MMTRTLAVLTMLALPLAAQEARSATTTDPETLFYKAFYLEKGERQNKQALELYQQFLAANPSHKYSKKAAQNAYGLFPQLGQLEEGDKFKAKYSELLKDASDAAAPRPGEGRPAAGGGAPGERPRGGRLQGLRDELEKAKAAGDDAKVKELEEQIKQAEAARPAGGPGGRRGGVLFSDRKISELNETELGEFKTALDSENITRMLEMQRERGQAEQADKNEKLIKTLKEQLNAGKKEDAQKTLDEIRAGMMRRRGGN